MFDKYRVAVQFDGVRNVYVAQAPELPSCQGEGATRAEALGELEEALAAHVAAVTAEGMDPPVPVDALAPAAASDPAADGALLSGVIQARISLSLHRELLYHSRLESLPLDALVSELLAEGLALREARALGMRDRARAGTDEAPKITRP